MKRTLNTIINRSKSEKNDEHYTQLSDIEVEVCGAETNVVEYVWGNDLSGSFQGAGGVGGLLYEKRNGAIYIPYQDAFGNIMGYWDTNGFIVAEYSYDAFGKLISQTGSMADMFRHRFSTKYYDEETGFYYYGYRYYFPELRRWLSRDPLEEEGGENQYSFCMNSPLNCFDDLGDKASSFRFAGDPNINRGDYIALWGPNNGLFSVKWEYEGTDCCGGEKETEKYGPLFFNGISDYYPVWNTETIDKHVPIPYQTPAFGVNGTSGATQGKVYGAKGKMTITIVWTSSPPSNGINFNQTGYTDYSRHGATWNMPNHFPWTDKPFAPFDASGNTVARGRKRIKIIASWDQCSEVGAEMGTVITGNDEMGNTIGIGKPRNKGANR